jgi:hypothetical protein
MVMMARDGRSPLEGYVATSWALGAGAGLLGAFLVTRHPYHRVGWLFLATGITRALAGFGEVWSVHAYLTAPGSLPFGPFATWVQAAFPLPGFALATATIALFPDDRPAGRRERVVLVFAAFALVVLAVVVPAGMWQFRGYDLLPDTPVPDSPVAHVFVGVEAVGIVAAVAGILIGLWSLVSRARRTTSIG